MEYLRDKFVLWLSNKKRDNGSSYSKVTISNYVTALKSYSAKLADIKLENSDIFYVSDVDQFEGIYSEIQNSKYYKEINESNHRIFSSALEIYKVFLNEKNLINDTMDEDESLKFEEWLKVYPKHKYTDTTIKRYIRALDKAEEWLNISLKKPILNIISYEEFLETQKIIKNLDCFSKVNQDHGHGDLSAALSLYEKYLLSLNEDEKENEIMEDEVLTKLSTSEIIDYIKKYIEGKGFCFEKGLIENFFLSLKSKPFVLLAGTSGTGKTRLARLFAEAIGAFDNGRYLQVAVKPDWSDSTDLFGHVNLDNKFIPGAIVEFIKKAENDPELPYILCLDEMNLARVEYYFSDFLSVMETRDWSEKGKNKNG